MKKLRLCEERSNLLIDKQITSVITSFAVTRCLLPIAIPHILRIDSCLRRNDKIKVTKLESDQKKLSYTHHQLEYLYHLYTPNWFSSINQTFNLKNDWTMYWNSFYSGRGRNGNSVSKPSYDMSFRVKKYFFDQKLRVLVKADNIFKTSRWRSVTTQDNVTTNWTNRWETRKFTLSLTYNFGSGKKKRVKAINLYDEQRRL